MDNYLSLNDKYILNRRLSLHGSSDAVLFLCIPIHFASLFPNNIGAT